MYFYTGGGKIGYSLAIPMRISMFAGNKVDLPFRKQQNKHKQRT